jgi:hypothetical protein
MSEEHLPTAEHDEGRPSAAATLAEKTVTDEDGLHHYEPSVTISVFVTWILPVLLIAILTRFAVDKDAMDATLLRPPPPKPIQIDLSSSGPPHPSSSSSAKKREKKKNRPSKVPTPVPTLVADKPSGYIEVVQEIRRRRLDWGATDTGSSSHRPSASPSQNAAGGEATHEQTPHAKKSETSAGARSGGVKPKRREPSRGASSDPVRLQLRGRIDQMRMESQVSQAPVVVS